GSLSSQIKHSPGNPGRFMELAREEFDYLSAEEIAEEIRRDSERGYCCHGFERNCCPLGCGDLGDDCCDAADLMEEP
ncbi:hypothetical protein P1O32_003266, partial [Escherichia coli]|nr:hypothetical protein [Escherichia coli]